MSHSNSTTIRGISSFTGNGIAGNQHLVMTLDSPINIQVWKGLSALVSDYILVVLQWPNNEHGKVHNTGLHAFFFQRGYEIRRCGSGCIAAARFLIDCCTNYHCKLPMTLHTAAGNVRIGTQGQCYYESPFLPIQRVPLRPWQSLVSANVADAFTVGGEGDYCIVRVKSEKGLRRCHIHKRKVQLSTKRALIVTTESGEPTIDYGMRYFAPQYGNDEDSATGSANAMLGVFWQNMLNKQVVVGRQRSFSGGLFRVERRGLRQRVYGLTQSHAVHSRIHQQLSEFIG